jgi:hypothetical protein
MAQVDFGPVLFDAGPPSLLGLGQTDEAGASSAYF